MRRKWYYLDAPIFVKGEIILIAKRPSSDTTVLGLNTSKLSSFCPDLFRIRFTTMKTLKSSLLLFVTGIFVLAGEAAAQKGTFADVNHEFTFEIPDDRWKVVGKSPVTVVFGTAKEGELEVRKITAPAAKPLGDVMKSEEEKLQFSPGFVAGKDENFSGAMRGGIYNYEFVKSGRPMAGRFYYLRNGDAVYVLRFTAYTNNLRSLRTQTDVMARTFQLKRS